MQVDMQDDSPLTNPPAPPERSWRAILIGAAILGLIAGAGIIYPALRDSVPEPLQPAADALATAFHDTASDYATDMPYQLEATMTPLQASIESAPGNLDDEDADGVDDISIDQDPEL